MVTEEKKQDILIGVGRKFEAYKAGKDLGFFENQWKVPLSFMEEIAEPRGYTIDDFLNLEPIDQLKKALLICDELEYSEIQKIWAIESIECDASKLLDLLAG